jgi:hypothetical protein
MKACHGSRRKERREDSDDARVRGHKESTKNSTNLFWGVAHGVSGEPRNEPDTVRESKEELDERFQRESHGYWPYSRTWTRPNVYMAQCWAA